MVFFSPRMKLKTGMINCGQDIMSSMFDSRHERCVFAASSTSGIPVLLGMGSLIVRGATRFLCLPCAEEVSAAEDKAAIDCTVQMRKNGRPPNTG